jgi:hypothetical protein
MDAAPKPAASVLANAVFTLLETLQLVAACSYMRQTVLPIPHKLRGK